jgi:hypothetical protein
MLCLVLCAVATPAYAQMKWTDQITVNANLGAQVRSSDLTVTTPFELYDEQGSVTSTQDVKTGAFFDISAGYKVWRNLAVGIGYTRASGKADASISAQVPDDLRTDSPRSVTASASGVKHTENAVNISGTWMVPFTDKIDIGVVFGPTIFSVKQEVPNSLSVNEPGPVVTSVGVGDVKETTVGIHLGVDVSYMLNKRYGVGGLARYSWGSIDIPNATESLTVGGFQIGAGVRIRF